MKKIKIVIIDDHKIFRDGLIMLLSNFDFVSVVGQASNGEEFLDLIDKVTAAIFSHSKTKKRYDTSSS